uniref:Prokaryotic-type class I peptide chain release factors domain-containing protein n=1 Tax=Aegilops tauschii subsp. strangulata TaxID=200361 RepID=A0A453G6C9_AEGTS
SPATVGAQSQTHQKIRPTEGDPSAAPHPTHRPSFLLRRSGGAMAARALLLRTAARCCSPLHSPTAAPRLHPRLRSHAAAPQLCFPALSFSASAASTSSHGPSGGDAGAEGEDDKGGYENYLGMSDDELMAQCDMGTFKSSGPGGQHRNKRESAVRLRHHPTGIVAQVSFHCQVALGVCCPKQSG